MNPPHPPTPPLKIGITGVTGFLGSHLAETARREGHTVVGFSRDPFHEMPGCAAVRPFTPGHLSVEGLDAVVHLAGESIAGRWSPTKKERILSSRREGTRALVDALLRTPQERRPRTLVCASAIGIYGDTGDKEVDEATPPGNSFLAEVARVWEYEALRASEAGVRVIPLRLGVILGRGGGVLRLLRPLYKAGLGAQLGSGRQWVSWVHVRDAARLALFCVENEAVAAGPLNATSPTPLRQAEWASALARHWGRRIHLTAPEPLLRLALGEAAALLLESQRVHPRRAIDLGFAFHFPTL